MPPVSGWPDSGSSGGSLAVRTGRILLVPTFQLTDDLDIDPDVADVVAELVAGGMSDWAVWRWATTPNSWLDGAAPADVLPVDGAAVERAVSGLFQ